MDTNNIVSHHSEDSLRIGKKQKAVISQANVVKQDIDELLMYLGANYDTNAIAQKMEQLGRNIADLYTCIHEVSLTGRHGAMPC